MRRYLVVLAVLLSAAPVRAQSTHCYLAADKSDGNSNQNSPDRLTSFDWSTATETDLGIITGNSAKNIEALAFNPVAQKLYATDAGQFGVIDVNTAVFTKIGTGVGISTNGSAGKVTFDDLDGLMFNPEDGQLYAVQRRTGNADDVLLKINPATGTFIPNAFDTDGNGSGDRDYVVINSVSSDARVSPPDPAVPLRDIDDIAFVYSGGSSTLYGIANDGSGLPRRNVLVTINKDTGLAKRVNPVGQSKLTLGDVEGFTADAQGTLYATTGNDSKNDDGTANPNTRNSFYRLAPDGTPTKLASLGQFGAGITSADYEGVACLLDGVGVLPVELTSFDALVDGDAVQLAWTTASETNNAGFEVHLHNLPSAIGNLPWQVLGFVDGHGTTEQAQGYGYRVEGLAPGRYAFRLKQIDYDGSFAYSPAVEVSVALPQAFLLSAAYPNPFNPETRFTLQLRRGQPVAIHVYDVLGRRVQTLFDGTLEAGQARVFRFEAGDLPGGAYLIRVEAAAFSATQRVVLVR